jgi:hypothetical protein
VRADDAGHHPSPNQLELQEDPQDAQHEPPRWGFWLLGTGLVAAVLILATLLSPWVRNEWALSLGRRDSSYTQLGFTDAAALPATIARGKSVPVSFVVINDEGKNMSYEYVVQSGSGSKLETLKTATKDLTSGESWDVRITVVPKCADSDCRIKVSLPQQAESVDFKFTYPSKSGKKSK